MHIYMRTSEGYKEMKANVNTTTCTRMQRNNMCEQITCIVSLIHMHACTCVTNVNSKKWTFIYSFAN